MFRRLRAANLTVNLVKSNFEHARVTYLGHVVGQDQVKPVTAKVEAIINYPVPNSKTKVMRFLECQVITENFVRTFKCV